MEIWQNLEKKRGIVEQDLLNKNQNKFSFTTGSVPKIVINSVLKIKTAQRGQILARG